jgi:hypothetical protein
MAEHATKRSQSQSRSRGSTQTQNPAEIARRELIAWCQAHQLPVPHEHRPHQSNGR